MVKWWSIAKQPFSQAGGLILSGVNHVGDMNAEIRLINPEIDIIILHHQAADTKAMPWLLRGRVDACGKYIQAINGFLQFYAKLRFSEVAYKQVLPDHF